MQRICEEKARRIEDGAFMEDCQCVWGQMREWPTDWPGGPGEAQNVRQIYNF